MIKQYIDIEIYSFKQASSSCSAKRLFIAIIVLLYRVSQKYMNKPCYTVDG